MYSGARLTLSHLTQKYLATQTSPFILAVSYLITQHMHSIQTEVLSFWLTRMMKAKELSPKLQNHWFVYIKLSWDFLIVNCTCLHVMDTWCVGSSTSYSVWLLAAFISNQDFTVPWLEKSIGSPKKGNWVGVGFLITVLMSCIKLN